eukprot:INCI1478.1.p1 GENE.INCI1478.1~~INCI1478.1.p1  ORF type:complete len:110 (-),score=21.44 INCI1478.1:89-418(-)
MSYEIKKETNGEKFTFNLLARNGQVILSASQGYTSKQGCKVGIASVATHARDAKFFESYDDAGGHPRFRLKAANGNVIGKSQGYASKQMRDHGIQSVMTNCSAGIKDLC